MKNLKKYLCAGLCLALAAFMAACSGETEKTPSSSQASSGQPESSAVSSAPSEPEAESSRFVPAPDLIPSTPESSGAEADGFDGEFSQNPIDKQYDEAYSHATSFSMMRQACDEAAKQWKAMVDVAYNAAMGAIPEEDQSALRQEQEQWSAGLNSRIETVRAEAGDDNEGILTASKQIVLIYRDRAMALCRVKYEADGELPEFPGEEEAVG